eukprot:3157756-Alexandrium_andersonii.AAC.1
MWHRRARMRLTWQAILIQFPARAQVRPRRCWRSAFCHRARGARPGPCTAQNVSRVVCALLLSKPFG